MALHYRFEVGLLATKNDTMSNGGKCGVLECKVSQISHVMSVLDINLYELSWNTDIYKSGVIQVSLRTSNTLCLGDFIEHTIN